MKQQDLIYTAGLFDGEGTVTLCRNYPSRLRSPYIIVSSCTYKLVKYLKQIWGGCISTKRKYQPQHLQAYAWALRNDAALRFLAAILSYMKEPKKIRRAKFLLENYKKVTKRNGYYTLKERQRKQNFELNFFQI